MKLDVISSPATRTHVKNRKRCHVSVEFFDERPVNQVVEEIASISKPHVILWYIGPTGLKKAGVEFYRNFIISPLWSCDNNTNFWLIDLTAWSAFKNPHCSIHKTSRCCSTIQEFDTPKLRCISTANVFEKIIEIKETEIVNYFNEALKRTFISQSSIGFRKKSILTGDLFSRSCLLASNWHDVDAAKSYSVFQYLEGCLLCEEIFVKALDDAINQTINIVFALPNDELKYYRDNENSFQKDLEFLLQRHCQKLNLDSLCVNVKFMAFKYSSQTEHRPYNAPGQILKHDSLLYEDVVGCLPQPIDMRLKQKCN